MRSLFVKIFLWFWLAMTLSSVALIILAVTTQIGPVAQHRRQLVEVRKQMMGQALSLYGQAALEAFARGGQAALKEFADHLEKETRIRIFLFEGETQLLSVLPVSPATRDLVARVAQTGQVESDLQEDGFLLARPLIGPGKRPYIIIGEWPNLPLRPPRPWSPFHRDFGLRLVVSLVIGGIVCYGLAWHLTAPIRRLRRATHQLASGDLTARVGEELGQRRDEIADLGMDFDRMAERIEALVKAQQRLIRDISHELRSPLARLNVALELARRNCSTAASGPLNRIEREAERLNDLIAQLVTLTLLESGIDTMGKSWVNLVGLVREIADDADFEARNKSRSVKVMSGDDITISGSEEMLHRAIENVVRNAVRYTAEGTEVEITLSHVQKDGETHALIRVSDHGPGVPEAALTQLFQPFYRVTDARDRMTGGAGIGLAITERAVHLHGGMVTASNSPEGGLVVEIELPVAGDTSNCPSVVD